MARPSVSTWHPIHGMLAAFPLALFVSALLSDIAYARSANIQWADFSIWLITGGIAVGVIAALVGIIDGIANRGRARRPAAPLHGVLTIVTFVVAIINAFVHSRDGWTSVVPTGLILSAITAVLIIVTSWLGYAAQPVLAEEVC